MGGGLNEREGRFSEYEQAPGYRPGPRVGWFQ